MSNSLDLAKVSEHERLAFYGALFSIALADGSLDKEEIELLFGIIDLEGMTESAKREVQSYIIEPPSLYACLKSLEAADENLRYGLMINLVDTAWANDELDANEKQAITLAQQELKISDKQLDAIEKFINKVREIRIRGLDDNYAADTIKTAAAGLSAVGVPVAAVWFSGSVIGLSAAGITSGLAGLGALIGLGGMIPGIGVAILLGTGIFIGVNTLLDTGDKSKKAKLQAEKERKAQLVIKNMQDAINQLVERIAKLQEKTAHLESSAADAEANREAIQRLTERLKFMQQSVAKRKHAFGAS
ncbi:MAG: TerB family tellurite resistance protein [Cyanobacteria bacterium SBC]|nr:TerB family tellurite resistance protein [Cyanobacteria bacterium SBC]